LLRCSVNRSKAAAPDTDLPPTLLGSLLHMQAAAPISARNAVGTARERGEERASQR
jgi:hypothetical protein